MMIKNDSISFKKAKHSKNLKTNKVGFVPWNKVWLICLKNCFLSGQSTWCEMAPVLTASAHTWLRFRTRTIISRLSFQVFWQLGYAYSEVLSADSLLQLKVRVTGNTFLKSGFKSLVCYSQVFQQIISLWTPVGIEIFRSCAAYRGFIYHFKFPSLSWL